MDVWSLGCIFAYMLYGSHIFYQPLPKTSEIQEIFKLILEHLGADTEYMTFLEEVTFGGIFMKGKINGRDKYDGFTEKPPHYPRHLFTGPNTIF